MNNYSKMRKVLRNDLNISHSKKSSMFNISTSPKVRSNSNSDNIKNFKVITAKIKKSHAASDNSSGSVKPKNASNKSKKNKLVISKGSLSKQQIKFEYSPANINNFKSSLINSRGQIPNKK